MRQKKRKKESGSSCRHVDMLRAVVMNFTGKNRIGLNMAPKNSTMYVWSTRNNGAMSQDQLQVGCHVENWDKCDRREDVYKSYWS